MSRTACQTFLFGPEEKEVFKAMMRQQARFAGIEILTFCIMDNHFHILLRVPKPTELTNEVLLARYTDYYGETKIPQSTYSLTELKQALSTGGEAADSARARITSRMQNLPAYIRELKQRFSIWYNAKHNNAGTIWAARYKSLLVEDCPESLTKVAAYIDLNPVRAEIVSDPQDYRYCGYAEAIAGIAVAQKGIAYLYNQSRKYTEAIQSYRLILFGKGYATKGTPLKDKGRLTEKQVSKIEQRSGAVTFQELLRARIRYFSDGMALGSERFIENQFNQNRQLFGQKRPKGGHKINGSFWEGLHVIRNLKRNVYS
jgi:hypothetical protein